MDEIIAWLITLIDFNTTALGTDAERCVSFICETLTARGVSVRTYTTAGNKRKAHHLLAEVPGDSPDAVMLHAHMDTADYGITAEWLFPADRASVRQSCICGRGAIDCKGPLAVWMKLLADAADGRRRPYTLMLLVSDLEEEGGQDGLGMLLDQHTEILPSTKLVIGEGGGYPFPFQNHLYYSFQTGERDDSEESSSAYPDWKSVSAILSMGVEKGYYSDDILTYARQAASLSGRRMDVRPLYEGMEMYFKSAPKSDVYKRYGQCFEAALREKISNARLMPCISPGYSDNRWFREKGIPVIGFFPLDSKNSLSGIHGANEYISEASLRLAYSVMTRVLEKLVL